MKYFNTEWTARPSARAASHCNTVKSKSALRQLASLALMLGMGTNLAMADSYPNQGPVIAGAVIGGAAGVILGQHMGGDAGAVLGAAAGAAVGASVAQNQQGRHAETAVRSGYGLPPHRHPGASGRVVYIREVVQPVYVVPHPGRGHWKQQFRDDHPRAYGPYAYEHHPGKGYGRRDDRGHGRGH